MQPSRTAQSTPPQSNTDQADSEEKRKLIAEKTKELEQVTRLNVISEDLVAYLKKLSSNSNELSKGAEGKKKGTSNKGCNY
jgi:hypothetical protein